MNSAQQEYQRSFYDRHYPKRAAAVREQLHHPLLRSFNERLAEVVLAEATASNRGESDRPVRVYEPGCGEALLGSGLSRVAARRGLSLSYTGADLSQGALDVAATVVSGDLRRGDATDVTAELDSGSQDVVVAKNLLHHLPDPAGFLRQVARVLRPGGRLVAFEPSLGCPQFLLFNALAPRRERYYWLGQGRNREAIASAGLRVTGRDRFGWLPFELAFVIRPGWFRRMFSTGDPRVIGLVSQADDWLTAHVPWLASYVVWVATPAPIAAGTVTSAPGGDDRTSDSPAGIVS
jgi:SAM-dependent methyltransferase